VDDPKGGWGLSIFSAKDQSEVEGLTAADPIILDDVGARYEISAHATASDEGIRLSRRNAAIRPPCLAHGSKACAVNRAIGRFGHGALGKLGSIP